MILKISYFVKKRITYLHFPISSHFEKLDKNPILDERLIYLFESYQNASTFDSKFSLHIKKNWKFHSWRFSDFPIIQFPKTANCSAPFALFPRTSFFFLAAGVSYGRLKNSLAVSSHSLCTRASDSIFAPNFTQTLGEFHKINNFHIRLRLNGETTGGKIYTRMFSYLRINVKRGA